MLENEAAYSGKAKDMLSKKRLDVGEAAQGYNLDGGWEVCATEEHLMEGGMVEAAQDDINLFKAI